MSDPIVTSSKMEKSAEFEVTDSALYNNFNTSTTASLTPEIKEHSEESRNGLVHRFVDSFRRAESQRLEEDNDLEDGTKSMKSNNHLKKSMKSRHVVMMSLGTGIGTGLLVANAKGLSLAGPGSLVIGYVMVSFVTYFMVQAAGEMGVTYPTLPGNFNAYNSIFISKSFGFATT